MLQDRVTTSYRRFSDEHTTAATTAGARVSCGISPRCIHRRLVRNPCTTGQCSGEPFRKQLGVLARVSEGGLHTRAQTTHSTGRSAALLILPFDTHWRAIHLRLV